MVFIISETNGSDKFNDLLKLIELFQRVEIIPQTSSYRDEIK
jgi:hypothetical protein